MQYNFLHAIRGWRLPDILSEIEGVTSELRVRYEWFQALSPAEQFKQSEAIVRSRRDSAKAGMTMVRLFTSVIPHVITAMIALVAILKR